MWWWTKCWRVEDLWAKHVISKSTLFMADLQRNSIAHLDLTFTIYCAIGWWWRSPQWSSRDQIFNLLGHKINCNKMKIHSKNHGKRRNEWRIAKVADNYRTAGVWCMCAQFGIETTSPYRCIYQRHNAFEQWNVRKFAGLNEFSVIIVFASIEWWMHIAHRSISLTFWI